MTGDGYVETEIGTLPADWQVVQLGDVCSKGETTNPQAHPEKEFVYVDVSAVSNQSYCIVAPTPTLGKDASSRARKLIKWNDVLVATIRPSLKRIAIVPKALDGQVCSTAFCVVRAKTDIASPWFLFNLMLTESVTARIAELESGSSYPAVTDTHILDQLIPLPPLPEQKKDCRHPFQDSASHRSAGEDYRAHQGTQECPDGKALHGRSAR